MNNIFKHFRKSIAILSLSTLLLISACTKEEKITSPSIVTTEISEVTKATAVTGGKISLNGGDPINASGVCWGTTTAPTIAGNKTTDTANTGDFSSTINGLIAGTTYYVRAYMVNSTGTSYGNEVSFLTLGNSIASKIVFGSDNNIYTISINGANLKQLTNFNPPSTTNNDNGYAEDICWFPDVTKLAYSGTITNKGVIIDH